MIISKELGINFQTSKNDKGNTKVLQKLKNIIYEEFQCFCLNQISNKGKLENGAN